MQQQVEDFEAEVDSQIETAEASIEYFRSLADTVKSSFLSRQETLTSQFDTFEEDIKAKLDSLMQDFAALIQAGEEKLSDLETIVDNTSSEVITSMSEKFIEEAVGKLSNSGKQLNEAISNLKDVGESSKGSFRRHWRYCR